jgi:hypothetical integral membrane protein (TIGR02206 family)
MEVFYIDNKDFITFNTEHKIWLLYAILSTILWVRAGRRAATPAAKYQIALTMGMVGIVAWVYANIVMFATNQATLQSVIPLHLCYFLNFALPYIFWKNRIDLLDWLYPIIMAGCTQALFTPDLDERFPHYYNVRYWLVHVGLIQYVFYGIFVFGFRPTAKGILKCVAFINLYAICLIPINWLLDTNFLYLRKPAGGSLMEKLGPWPQYLLGIEVLMFVLFAVVYLPFLFVKKSDAKATA